VINLPKPTLWKFVPLPYGPPAPLIFKEETQPVSLTIEGRALSFPPLGPPSLSSLPAARLRPPSFSFKLCASCCAFRNQNVPLPSEMDCFAHPTLFIALRTKHGGPSRPSSSRSVSFTPRLSKESDCRTHEGSFVLLGPFPSLMPLNPPPPPPLAALNSLTLSD